MAKVRRNTLQLLSVFACVGISTFFYSQPANSNPLCSKVYVQNTDVSNRDTLENTISQLAELRLNIDLELAAGNPSPILLRLERDFENKFSELKQFLSEPEALLRIHDAIAIIQTKHLKKSESKEEQKKQTKTILDNYFQESAIIMNPLPTGKFNSRIHKKEKVIAEPFFMQNTPMTQLQWAKLAYLGGFGDSFLAPSIFSKGSNASEVILGSARILIQKNNPVENISFEDVNLLLTRLSVLSRTGDIDIQNKIREIIPDHQRFDEYDLPTEDQWEYVATHFGQKNLRYYDLDTPVQNLKYTWARGNSNNQTQPVASKLPRMINDQAFYDMQGNVWHWLKDIAIVNIGRSLSYYSNEYPYHLLIGGSYAVAEIPNVLRSNLQSHKKNSTTGFRIVRIRR